MDSLFKSLRHLAYMTGKKLYLQYETIIKKGYSVNVIHSNIPNIQPHTQYKTKANKEEEERKIVREKHETGNMAFTIKCI